MSNVQSGCKANRTALPPLKQNHHCIGHFRDMINDHDMFIMENNEYHMFIMENNEYHMPGLMLNHKPV